MIDLQNCDAFELMAELNDNSIDAIITDPPYGTTQLEWDTAPDLELMFSEFKRIAKPHAPMVMFSAQPFTTDLINAGRDVFSYSLVWEKTSPTNFLAANRQPLKAHEDILIFSKKSCTYNPQMWHSKPKGVIVRKYKPEENKSLHYGGQKDNIGFNNGERFPVSVLSFSNSDRTKTLHPTQKPLDLLCYLAKTYSNEGETILDPFAGSGTTAHAAYLTGRIFIGCEINQEYFEKAKKRLDSVQKQPNIFEKEQGATQAKKLELKQESVFK
ncbi:type II methyltransferase M.HpaI-like [Acropora palmata]|uniref:type II methyltransferase M.HpaI-like n=1 Tax=Acropora palmata TaxID=6131 RepID=UPI003D9FC068